MTTPIHITGFHLSLSVVEEVVVILKPGTLFRSVRSESLYESDGELVSGLQIVRKFVKQWEKANGANLLRLQARVQPLLPEAR